MPYIKIIYFIEFKSINFFSCDEDKKFILMDPF